VGGTKTLSSDARIIASTNRDLEKAVAERRFRADVHFRLNVVHLKVPPLRERRDDILSLAQHFIRRFCVCNAVPGRSLSAAAARLLEHYEWPGNVRELENLMEGLMAILPSAHQTIADTDILAYSDRIRQATSQSKSSDRICAFTGVTYREALEQFEVAYLKALLEAHGGNVTHAAKAADIHPVTFHRKLRKLRIVR
jgi:two-component system nitrogen regulation response regulator NtrX